MSIQCDFGENILNQIKDFCKKKPTEESCGIILKCGDFVPCDNIARDKRKCFVIQPEELVFNEVAFIVHSHWQGPSRPSSLDKKCSDDFEIPFLIYSIPDDNFCLYQNKGVTKIKV